MKEFIQNIFETSNERIKNPFIGSYIIAFILYNWRVFLLLLFSDSKIEDKIIVINHEYCYKDALFWPLGIALFYVLVLPYVNLLFENILTFSNFRKDELKKKDIINKLKQKKAEAKYEREIAEERAGTSEITELKNQIERLNSENEKLSLQNKSTFDRYENTIENIKVRERELRQNLKNLEDENAKNQKELLKNNDFISHKELEMTVHNLDDEQQRYFVEYINYLNKGLPKSIIIDSEYLNYFENLKLVLSDKENSYTLTRLGYALYYYLLKLK